MPISNSSMPSVPDGVHVDDLTLDPCGLLITAHTTTVDATCPSCGRSSTRMHSAYWRTLKDLPWQDRAVTWRLKVRRLRCSHCLRRIFAERVPGLALSRRLAMPVSHDTVLRLIRHRGINSSPPPRVVGIDDWAWRRGRTAQIWLKENASIQIVARDRGEWATRRRRAELVNVEGYSTCRRREPWHDG